MYRIEIGSTISIALFGRVLALFKKRNLNLRCIVLRT